MRLLLASALMVACLPLAADVKVGDTAPDIQAMHWINPPAWSSLADLKGDVVMIKAWGKN